MRRLQIVSCMVMAMLLAGPVARADDPATDPASAPGGPSAEVVLLEQLEDANRRLARLAARAERAELAADETAARLAELEAAKAEIEAALARVRSQRDVALDGREAAEADARATDRASRNWRIATYLLALVLAVSWMVASSRRRDTVRIRIPDTIEELDHVDHRADR